MRYFRIYPWGLQLFLFVMLWFTLSSFGYVIVLSILPKLAGFSISDIQGITPGSDSSLIRAAVIVQGILNLFSFLLPAFLFAYLSHPSPSAYLGLRPAGKKIQWLLVALVMLGAMPVLEMLDGLMSHIDFGPKIKAIQDENDNMMGAFLNIPDARSFIWVFIVAAVVPALGEDMFFRGVTMRFIKKRTKTMAIPIILSALIFAFFHFNIYGFVSIFAAGLLLAGIYYLTGSLWCSIFAHLLFNGLQIILSFAGNTSPAIKAFMSNTAVPLPLVVGGAIVFAVSFYLLLKNKTPLQRGWTNDFLPGELPGFDFGEKK